MTTIEWLRRWRVAREEAASRRRARLRDGARSRPLAPTAKPAVPEATSRGALPPSADAPQAGLEMDATASPMQPPTGEQPAPA